MDQDCGHQILIKEKRYINYEGDSERKFILRVNAGLYSQLTSLVMIEVQFCQQGEMMNENNNKVPQTKSLYEFYMDKLNE